MRDNAQAPQQAEWGAPMEAIRHRPIGKIGAPSTRSALMESRPTLAKNEVIERVTAGVRAGISRVFGGDCLPAAESLCHTLGMRTRVFVPAVMLSLSANACGADSNSGDGHDVIQIEMHWAENISEDPFVGTTRLVARLKYSQCINQFYLADSPAYQFDAIEGEKVLNDWVDNNRICDGDEYLGAMGCEVESVQQVFIDAENPDAAQGLLTINFTITDDDLSGRKVVFGPLPDAGLTDATCGGKPNVSINQDVLKGYDANDVLLWEVSTFGYTGYRVGQTAVGEVLIKTVM